MKAVRSAPSPVRPSKPFPEPVDRWPMIGPPSLAALGLDKPARGPLGPGDFPDTARHGHAGCTQREP